MQDATPRSFLGYRRFLRIPQVIKREFRTRGGDARFLMWISFLVGFAWVRMTDLLMNVTQTHVTIHDDLKLGSPAEIGGYHPHHSAAGVFFLAVAGWLGIHYAGPRVLRAISLLYGVGLAFIADQVGFIVEGVGQYYGYRTEMFTLVVLIAGIMMTSVYFPAFWNTHFPNFYQRTEQRVVEFVRRYLPSRAPAPRAAQPVSVEPPTPP